MVFKYLSIVKNISVLILEFKVHKGFLLWLYIGGIRCEGNRITLVVVFNDFITNVLEELYVGSPIGFFLKLSLPI